MANEGTPHLYLIDGSGYIFAPITPWLTAENH